MQCQDRVNGPSRSPAPDPMGVNRMHMNRLFARPQYPMLINDVLTAPARAAVVPLDAFRAQQAVPQVPAGTSIQRRMWRRQVERQSQAS